MSNQTHIELIAHNWRSRFRVATELAMAALSLLKRGIVRLAFHTGDPDPRVDAAQWVSQQYFEIAAEEMGEDEVRRRFHERMAARGIPGDPDQHPNQEK